MAGRDRCKEVVGVRSSMVQMGTIEKSLSFMHLRACRRAFLFVKDANCVP